MTSAATTWRSPLSILMGARRNDDTDLELREDYFHPRSPAAEASAPVNIAPAAATPKTPPAATESVEPSSKSSGLASYLPFSYFGLTSPAPASATNTDVNGEQSGSLAPPRGAFPPPISESPNEHSDQERVDVGEGDFPDERENQVVDQQFHASHPWFNQNFLEENSNDDGGDYNYPSNHPEFSQARANAKKLLQYITRKDQKAINGATFNFANSIIGAGAMGLGGAFAASGGGISVIMLIGFAYLTKQSLDLVVDLSSCPSVIREGRPVNAKDIESFDGSSFSSDSQSLSEELESNKPSTNDINTSSQIDVETPEEITGLKMDEQEKTPPVSNSTNDGEVIEGDKSQQSKKESSPLMANEEVQDENNENVDKGQGLDHPLAHSPGRQGEKERYDLLTMGVTQPRPFSALDLNTDDDTPKFNPANNIDNPLHQLQQHMAEMAPLTYEELGRAAFGSTGRMAVLLSKSLYAFGCLVAYVVVVRDNFGLALRRIIIGPTSPDSSLQGHEGHGWLYDDDFLAFWVSALIMLPLSCPRTMKPLAKFSLVSVISMIFLVLVVVYLFFTCTNPEGGTASSKSSFYENWIEIKSFSGLIESLGCFVFTFVCHHTVNLAYESLPPRIRNPRVWRRVSTNSIAIALQASLTIGIFAYLTFGSQTPADVLMGYPADLALANCARLLLCLTMVLTFPLPFLTCREMSILIFVDMHSFYHMHGLDRLKILRPVVACTGAVSSMWRSFLDRGSQEKENIPMQGEPDNADAANGADGADFVHMKPSFFSRLRWKRKGFGNDNFGVGGQTNEEWWDEMNQVGADVTQALLTGEEHETEILTSIGGQKGKEINPSPLSSRSGDPSDSETTISSVVVPTPTWILPYGDGRQLTFVWHAALTFMLWFIVTICAIKSPSLGDVLDLVGAFTGTLLAFVLPALFSFKLKGYSHMSVAILGIGGIVGLLGSIFSFIKFVRDVV